MDRYKILVLILVAAVLNGCIYNTDLGCEGFKDAGRSCKPVTSNVEYAVEKEKETEIAKAEKTEQEKDVDDLINYSINLGEANPLTTKAKTLKVTILPYVDDTGRLHMLSSLYIIIQKPDWIIGDYLIPADKGAVQ
jgi:conjugal transfer pilus assembly protein TraV